MSPVINEVSPLRTWVAPLLAGGLLVVPLVVLADTGQDGPPDQAPVTAVVITGSYLHRTDEETSSPVTTISAADIAKGGFNTLADVIRSVSADNSGTLSQNFSGAMAGGASGVSLRGLTVDATLVLVDGHRMAPYPLADDGQRSFVDISALPLGIVERVEVLRDGASAIYGSDAIAGVVNVILKKQFVGTEITGTAGESYRQDGATGRFGLTYGFGDLDTDLHNIYFNIEARRQNAIAQEDRGSYLKALNLAPWGGPNLLGGIVNGSLPVSGTTYTVPGQVIPVSNGVLAGPPYLLPGCQPQNLEPGGGCAWDTNLYKKIQPRTEGLNLSAHGTQILSGGWESTTSAHFFYSGAEQYRQPNAYNAGITLIPFAWAGSQAGTVNQFDPATTQVILPANNPDNPFNPNSPYFSAARAFYGPAFSRYIGLPAAFYGALTDIAPQHNIYRTDVVRLVEDLNGDMAGWDVQASAGYIADTTHITYQNYVRASQLYMALANNTLRVGQNAYLNSPALLDSLAPETSDTATSSVTFVSANASKDLLKLDGGYLAVATGVEARETRNDNPGQPNGPEGDNIMDGSFYASGSETVYAAFAELSAPLARTFEVDAAGRVDHYNLTGFSFTPKFGAKWTPVPEFAVRGTYAAGFRAPGIAESGNSGTASSVAPAPVDPTRCPYTGSIADCGGPGSSVAVLNRGNPDLKPERSKSYTIGVIAEPLKRFSVAMDYFHILRADEIVAAPYSLTNAVRSAPTPGTDYPGQIIEYLTPFVNASDSVNSGIDLDVRDRFLLAQYGRLTAQLQATHILESNQTFGDNTYHFAGTVGPTSLSGATGTPATRGTASLEWERDQVTLGLTYNYRGPMKGVDPAIGSGCIQLLATNRNCYVGSFSTLNMVGQYQWSKNLLLTGTITNLTNRLAPLDTATYGGQNYDSSLDQAGAVGRFVQLAFRYLM